MWQGSCTCNLNNYTVSAKFWVPDSLSGCEDLCSTPQLVTYHMLRSETALQAFVLTITAYVNIINCMARLAVPLRGAYMSRKMTVHT